MADTTTAAGAESRAATALPGRRRFTVDEYYRMAEAGILGPDERTELIEGEIIQMAPIGSWHADCVDFLTQWFVTGLAGRAIVRVQNPVRLSTGAEPQPDLALLHPRGRQYAQAHPGPDDVFLIVGVSDTTIRYDRGTKLPVYARAGVPEVWIVDLNGERVLVYRSPHAGRYQHAVTVERGSTLAPAAFPDLALPVGELLG